MNIENILNELTLEEKVSLLEGKTGKESAEIPRLGIKSKVMVDGFITESGVYNVHVRASSADIRLTKDAVYECEMPYTMSAYGLATVG